MRQKVSEPYDKVILALMLPATLGVPVVAGLGAVRFGWAPLSAWTAWPGAALHAAGGALVLWSMAVNPYLEKTVRVQAEHDHRVITAGPYRCIRHPMYAGLVLMFAAMPLVLGSGWAFVPVGAITVLIAARTAFEDRTLRDRLPGYAAYAARTRHRLVPGLW